VRAQRYVYMSAQLSCILPDTNEAKKKISNGAPGGFDSVD
jgi:hypothetical protein